MGVQNSRRHRIRWRCLILVAGSALTASAFADEPAGNRAPVNEPPVIPRNTTVEHWDAGKLAAANKAKIEEALARPVSLDFVETPLSDVVTFIREKTEINIVLDRKGLELVSILPDEPITIAFDRISLKSALHRILDPLDLTYVIRDEVLLITDKAETGHYLETRTYPALDLMVATNADGVVVVSAEDILDVITNSIEPDGWMDRGGDSTINVSATTGSLVVMAPDRIHEKVAKLLVDLRKAKKASSESQDLPALAKWAEAYRKAKREAPTRVGGMGGGASTEANLDPGKATQAKAAEVKRDAEDSPNRDENSPGKVDAPAKDDS